MTEDMTTTGAAVHGPNQPPHAPVPISWKWFLAPAVAISVGYGLLPPRQWKEPLYDALVTSAVVAIWIGTRRYRPDRANQWTALLIAMVCISAAEWIWFANDIRGISPFPGWGEALDLMGRGALLFALTLLSSRRGQLRDGLAVMDAAVIGIAVAALAWTFVFGGYFDHPGVDVVERLTVAAYLVLDVSLLVGFVLLVLEARRGTPAIRLLAAGVGILVIGDFFWLGLLAHHAYDVGHLLDAVWPIAYCTIAAAALHPTMRRLADHDALVASPGSVRLVILPIAVIALPGAGLTADILNIDLSPLDHLVVGFGTLVIGVAVAVRFLRLMRFVEHAADARGAHRTEALVRESLDIVAIVGADGRARYVSPPLERVLGWPAEAAIGRRIDAIAASDERPLFAQYFARVLESDFGTPLTFKLNLMSRAGDPVLMEVACVNRLDDPEIDGVIVSARDISERSRLEQEVAFYAFHDRLTGLANRSLLFDHIELVVRQRGDEFGAVFVLDLDDFTAINESLGHAAGDELLVSVGERLRLCTRPGDTLARLGGDEFAVLLVRADQAAVAASAQRVLEVLSLPLNAGSSDLAIAASIGIRVLGDGDTAPIAIRDANVAMNAAKQAGKGRFEVFDAEMGARAERRVSLIADLPGAWGRGEMQVNYQPIVEVPGGQIRGAEALLRWAHPVLGAVSPVEFVSLAEESGVIRELGLQVLREAARHAAHWRAKRAPGLYISVNISPVQMADSLPDTVAGILAAAGLDASALVLEITESMVLSSVESSLTILEAIRAHGIRIAIDDFGTGYSSLAYVQQFPIDLVKIDQSFTKVLDATHAGMVPTIIQLARTMHATVVAEGVETLEQMTELVRLECPLAQGYLFSPAVPAEAFARMLAEGALLPGGPDAAANSQALRPIG